MIKPQAVSRANAARNWLGWTVLVLVLAVVVVVRVRMLDMPLERDEGEYAYAGQLLLDGVPPYQEAYNMKMPGTFAAYAGIMAVFGQTARGIHLGLLVLNLATMGMLFLLARRIMDFTGAAVAASAFGLLSLSPSVLGLAAHATHFILLPALAGMWLLLREDGPPRWLSCLASGCLFGVAFLMKQHAVFLGVFGGLFLVYGQLRAAPGQRGELARRAGVFAAGCLLPFLLLCGGLAAAGVFGKFWFWTITYAREYAVAVSPGEGWIKARDGILEMLKAAPWVWAVAGAGLLALPGPAMKVPHRFFLAGLLLFSFLTACPGFYFRPHYFIPLLPAVALLAGVAVHAGEDWLWRKNRPAWLQCLPGLLAFAALAQSLYLPRYLYFDRLPDEASRIIYGVNPTFLESPEIARFIRENSHPDDRIVVMGSEPQIYFYAHRRSVTGYIYTYPLTEAQPFALEMQREMIREIEAGKPEYAVLVSLPASWLVGKHSHREISDWFSEYQVREMQLVGLVQFTGLTEREVVWGPAAAATPVRSRYFIGIFKRK